MNRVAIIDVGSGNLYSVEKAVRHVADELAEIFLCSEASQLEQATHIILPGVGAFADCMQGLQALPGMQEALEQQILRQKKPFFGICVGMQMLFERSFEHGETKGLGWLKGEVVSLKKSSGTSYQESEAKKPKNDQNVVGEASRPSEPSAREPARHVSDSSRAAGAKLKYPHMGWNDLKIQQNHPLLEGVSQGDHTYFVHSYHCVPEEEITVLSVDYGGPVVAAIARDNLFATQFHPEKSQKTGLRILQNFLQLRHANQS